MLNAWQVSELLAPVICRAQASAELTRSGFMDRAAHGVLRRLGRSLTLDIGADYNRCHLRRWRWIDERAVDFFHVHPGGKGVEVGGGLSTRFHRVSEQLDWPRFSWRAINTGDVTDCLQYVFPRLDNHDSVSVDNPFFEWHLRVDWQDPTAKIVIIGEHKPLESWNAFLQIAKDIQASLTEATPQVHVVISHTVEDFTELLSKTLAGATELNKLPSPKIGQGWLSKLAGFITGSYAREPEVSHLVFYKDQIAEEHAC